MISVSGLIPVFFSYNLAFLKKAATSDVPTRDEISISMVFPSLIAMSISITLLKP